MVLARNLRITFSHRSAPAGTLLKVAGSRINPAVWSLALWQVAQYFPMTAPACWESKACARTSGEISNAAAIVMKNLIIGSREASIYATGVIISTTAKKGNGARGDLEVAVIY